MAFKMKGWSAFTKKQKEEKLLDAETVKNVEDVKRSKTVSIDTDTGERVKRKVRQFGNVEKEKRISEDGTHYTKTKTKGGKTKTKSGRTIKGVWRDITGKNKKQQGGEALDPVN